MKANDEGEQFWYIDLRCDSKLRPKVLNFTV